MKKRARIDIYGENIRLEERSKSASIHGENVRIESRCRILGEVLYTGSLDAEAKMLKILFNRRK